MDFLFGCGPGTSSIPKILPKDFQEPNLPNTRARAVISSRLFSPPQLAALVSVLRERRIYICAIPHIPNPFGLSFSPSPSVCCRDLYLSVKQTDCLHACRTPITHSNTQNSRERAIPHPCLFCSAQQGCRTHSIISLFRKRNFVRARRGLGGLIGWEQSSPLLLLLSSGLFSPKCESARHEPIPMFVLSSHDLLEEDMTADMKDEEEWGVHIPADRDLSSRMHESSGCFPSRTASHRTVELRLLASAGSQIRDESVPERVM